MKARVLIVDDDEAMCRMLEADLSRRDVSPVACTDANQALTLLNEEDFDVVLTDMSMPGMDGIALCERVTANRPDVPVVVMTAFGSLDTAISAIRAGAYDFVTKPVDVDVLAVAIDRAAHHRALQEKVKILTRAVEQARRHDLLIGESPPMRALFKQLDRIGKSEASVLVTGETGTGKEVVARTLHRQGPSKDGLFVAVNCSALPEALLESELFGHKKGAFTDAKADRKGLFLEADGGTLFLDEVGEIPMPLQPKLLRALEEHAVRPVGSNEEVPFRARIIAATNRDLDSWVKERRFREDLYFRLNVIQLHVPPLRARGTDTLLLARHFIEESAARAHKKVTGLAAPAAEKLLEYAWPGNIRELRNAIEHAVALTGFDKIAVDDLPERIRSCASSHLVLGGINPTELVPLEAVDRRYIEFVLKSVGGNRTAAARILGLDRKTLYRKLKQYDAGEP